MDAAAAEVSTVARRRVPAPSSPNSTVVTVKLRHRVTMHLPLRAHGFWLSLRPVLPSIGAEGCFRIEQCGNLQCGSERVPTGLADGRSVVRVRVVVLLAGRLPPGVECVRVAPDHVSVASLLVELEIEMAWRAVEPRGEGV